MAKHKRKRRKRSVGGGGASGADFWVRLVRETLGNFAGQLMADGAEQMAAGRAGGDSAQSDPRDLATEILGLLAESGQKTIAEMVSSTGAQLTPLLRALQLMREFGLVQVVGDEPTVQLTPSGSKAASALRREQINSDGMKMLDS